MILLKSLAALSLFMFLLHGTIFAATVSLPGDEWERTVKAAEQEGQVTVYKLGTDAEFHAFQKRYPKIKLNLITGSGRKSCSALWPSGVRENFSPTLSERAAARRTPC